LWKFALNLMDIWSAVGLGRVKTPARSAHVEASQRNRTLINPVLCLALINVRFASKVTKVLRGREQPDGHF